MLDTRGISKPDGTPLPSWDLPLQLEFMEKLEISFAALSISTPHPHFGDPGETIEVVRASNEEGLDLVKKHPGRFGLFATLPLPEIEASLDEIKFALRGGAIGVAMPTHAQGIYLGDEALEPVFALLNEHKAIICYHPTTPAAVPTGVLTALPSAMLEFFFDTTRAISNMIYNGVVTRYPDIKHLIPHGGALLPIMSRRLGSFLGRFSAEPKPDVPQILRSFYYDLAGFVVPDQLDVLLRTTDESHLLYGTDSPYGTIESCGILRKELEDTDILTETQREHIYYKNAKGLLSLKQG